MEGLDTYKTLSKPSNEILFKEKKSKFFGYAFPITSEDEVKTIIDNLKKKHHTANHVCYAWQLGKTETRYRANDDGEPNNSAGLPIYGQIQSFNITNVLVAVARIFGGTKLGVGGLIGAYRTTAQLALNDAVIIERSINEEIKIIFGYPEMDKVMRIIKQNQLNIISQHSKMDCQIVLNVPKSRLQKTIDFFKALKNVTVIKK